VRSTNVHPLGKAPALEPPFQTQPFADLYGGVSRYWAASGSAIYHQEETADGLYYLEQGRIVLKVASPQGKDAIIGVLHAGAFFGEECLTSRTLRLSTATCLVDSVAARIEKASIRRAIRHDPRFAVFYLSRVVDQGDALKASLISQLAEGSEQRLARVLLQLAGLGDQAAGSVEGFDQEALAQMVGTTRSRVNHFMNRFRDLGHIAYNGKIAVHDSLWQVVLRQDRGGADENLRDSDQGELSPNR
jgi:CRP/FNR family transcriptional regulator, cyclic AMP receptor protein